MVACVLAFVTTSELGFFTSTVAFRLAKLEVCFCGWLVSFCSLCHGLGGVLALRATFILTFLDSAPKFTSTQ